MLELYTAYKCKKCKKTFILLSSEMVAAIGRGRYITCPYCSCNDVKVQKPTNNLKDYMTADSHTRHNGAIKQKTWKR